MNNDETTRSARRIATLIAIPLALLAGFIAFQVLKPADTGPVEIAAVQLDDRQATLCRALVAKLPEKIREQPRRQVTGGSEQNAAFGDPLIVLACGGTQPSFAPTDLVFPMNGVCWHANTDGSTWTTVDREAPVTLKLPSRHAGEGSGQWAAAFSSSITATVPEAAQRPSGCG